MNHPSITRFVRTLHKLRGRSVAEFRLRSRQALVAYLERVGVTDSDVPFDRALSVASDPASLLTRFRDGTRDRLFAGLASRESTTDALRRHCPSAEAEVVNRAERAMSGRFDLLGFKDVSFGAPIDWLADPLADRRSPIVHWSRVPFLDYETVGDHKVVWELNRHQHFVTLGQAYWYTGDERFAATFVSQVSHWLETNPPKLGINWASSLEVAFRAISWSWALQLFRDSPALTPALFGAMVASLTVHARHLATNLSTFFSPNTHLTGEALGLYYIARTIPELEGSDEWERLGRSILIEQLGRQVRDDGVYFEQASYYHRYTVDFYLHLLLLERERSATSGGEIEVPLQRLLDHLLKIARPDGTSPLFGDDDGGRLLFLDTRRSDDFRPSLSTGAVMFGSSHYAFAAGALSPETIWLAGAVGADRWTTIVPSPPTETSAAFDTSGYFVMRDGWTRTADVMLIDCGPHGILNCGHAHADALAIEVVAHGQTALADPGTFTYTTSRDARNHFRSSLAHSAVAVDGLSSSQPATPFTWHSIAAASARRWYSDDAFDFFEGTHDGFERLADPVAYRRSILFVKGAYWIIRDSIGAAGEHTLQVAFQAAAGMTADVLAPGVARVRPTVGGGAALDIIAAGQAGAFQVEDAWTSQAYGARTAAPKCAYIARTLGAASVTTCLVPHDATRPAWSLRSPTDATDALVLERPCHVDRMRYDTGGAALPAADVVIDAEFSWTRHASGNDAVTRCIAIGVRALRLGSISVVTPNQPVEWIVAERRENDWTVRQHQPARPAR